MGPAKSVGRLIGMLFLALFVLLTVPFILLHPMTTSAFLENAAGVSSQIRVAVLLLFANGALAIGIAIAGFPIFREHSSRMALWFLALGIIWFSMQAVDNVHILSMLSLSQQYTEAGASNAEVFGPLAAAVRSIRVWSHYTGLLVIDAWYFLFYSLLFRFSLVPRALAGFGLLMVLIHTAAIPLPMFVGYRSVFVLAYSMALGHLAVATWLMVKGFDERHRRLRAETS